MHRRRFLLGIAGVASVGTAGCLSSGAGASGDYDVGMGASSFEPPSLEVAAGETVVWRNTNSRAHTVTAYEDLIPADADYFASGDYASEQAARDAFFDAFGGAIASREEYEHTFTVPGEYQYFCVPHEKAGMVGSITVTE